MGKAIIVPNVSFADKNLGVVTPAGGELTELSISGPSTVANSENKASFTVDYTPSGTEQRGVVWSVESGGSYATIDSNTGVLTVLSGASASSVTIKATSIYNAAIYATKVIAVTYIMTVEYVASKGVSGIPYITTINPSGTYNYEMVFMLEDGDGLDIFGSRVSSNSQILRFFGESSTHKFRGIKNTSGNTTVELNHTIQTGKKYKVVMSTASSTGLKLYEVTDSGDTLLVQDGNMSASVSNNYPVLLGAFNNAGTPVAYTGIKLRIYSFKIYDSSQDILDLQPHFDTDNLRPALKDSLTNTVYPYNTTGNAILYYKSTDNVEQSIEIS